MASRAAAGGWITFSFASYFALRLCFTGSSVGDRRRRDSGNEGHRWLGWLLLVSWASVPGVFVRARFVLVWLPGRVIPVYLFWAGLLLVL